MSKLHQISAPELVKWIRKKGFKPIKTGKTSHIKLYKDKYHTTISMKHGKKKIPIGTLKEILSPEQTGLEDEYRKDF